jgi:hypothetical protein
MFYIKIILLITNLDVRRSRSNTRLDFISPGPRIRLRCRFSSFRASKAPFRSRKCRLVDVSPRSGVILNRTIIMVPISSFRSPHRRFIQNNTMIRVIPARSRYSIRVLILNSRSKRIPGSFNNKRLGFIPSRPRYI